MRFPVKLADGNKFDKISYHKILDYMVGQMYLYPERNLA